MKGLVLALVCLIGVGGLSYAVLFNALRSAANRVITAWAGIEAELQRRADLIPNLVAVVQANAEHERSVIEQVVRARAASVAAGASRETIAAADAEMSSLLPQVFVLAEAMPTLRTSESFLALQSELATTEDRLAAARRFYNFKVRDLNNLVYSVISGAIARKHLVAAGEYFGEPKA